MGIGSRSSRRVHLDGARPRLPSNRPAGVTLIEAARPFRPLQRHATGRRHLHGSLRRPTSAGSPPSGWKSCPTTASPPRDRAATQNGNLHLTEFQVLGPGCTPRRVPAGPRRRCLGRLRPGRLDRRRARSTANDRPPGASIPRSASRTRPSSNWPRTWIRSRRRDSR